MGSESGPAHSPIDPDRSITSTTVWGITTSDRASGACTPTRTSTCPAPEKGEGAASMSTSSSSSTGRYPPSK